MLVILTLSEIAESRKQALGIVESPVSLMMPGTL